MLSQRMQTFCARCGVSEGGATIQPSAGGSAVMSCARSAYSAWPKSSSVESTWGPVQGAVRGVQCAVRYVVQCAVRGAVRSAVRGAS